LDRVNIISVLFSLEMEAGRRRARKSLDVYTRARIRHHSGDVAVGKCAAFVYLCSSLEEENCHLLFVVLSNDRTLANSI